MEKEDYRHSLKSSYLQTMITNFDFDGFKSAYSSLSNSFRSLHY